MSSLKMCLLTSTAQHLLCNQDSIFLWRMKQNFNTIRGSSWRWNKAAFTLPNSCSMPTLVHWINEASAECQYFTWLEVHNFLCWVSGSVLQLTVIIIGRGNCFTDDPPPQVTFPQIELSSVQFAALRQSSGLYHISFDGFASVDVKSYWILKERWFERSIDISVIVCHWKAASKRFELKCPFEFLICKSASLYRPWIFKIKVD